MQALSQSIVVMAVALSAAACSPQQFYGVGQTWQRNECNKIIDSQERARCNASASKSFDAYQREAEAAREGK
jgi:hypothetical protein